MDGRGYIPHGESEEKAIEWSQVRYDRFGIKAAASVRMERKGRSEKYKYIF